MAASNDKTEHWHYQFNQPANINPLRLKSLNIEFVIRHLLTKLTFSTDTVSILIIDQWSSLMGTENLYRFIPIMILQTIPNARTDNSYQKPDKNPDNRPKSDCPVTEHFYARVEKGRTNGSYPMFEIWSWFSIGPQGRRWRRKNVWIMPNSIFHVLQLAILLF